MTRDNITGFKDKEGQKIPAGLPPIIDAQVPAHYTFAREK